MDGGSWQCIGGTDKDHPQEKEMKKAKWLSEEVLQRAMKRREAKKQRRKGRYTHFNTEFQIIVRRDKKAFLSDEWSMQRNRGKNRMGMTRDFLKNIRHTKGTFHAKMGSIKDRNGMELTEAEDI